MASDTQTVDEAVILTDADNDVPTVAEIVSIFRLWDRYATLDGLLDATDIVSEDA